MRSFFEANLPEVFLIYGLAFVVLGVVVFDLPKQGTRLRIIRHLWLLAAFGLIHGALEFFVLWKMVHQAAGPVMDWIGALLLLASFLPLLEFSRRLLWRGKLAAIANARRHFVPGLYAALFILILMMTLLAQNAPTGFAIATRLLVGFPAALLTGIGLLSACGEQQPVNIRTLRGYLRAAALGFIGYSIFTAVVAKTDPGLPLPVPSESGFLDLFGVPVQAMRALCAVVVAVAVTLLVRRKNYESRMRELEQVREAEHANSRMEQAQKIARLGSFEWDMISGKLRWSAEHFRLWGIEPDSVTPDHELFRRGVHPDDLARIEDDMRRLIEEGMPYDNEYRVIRPDGSVRHLQGRAEVTFDESGRALRMNGTVHDVTESRQIESELKLAKFIIDKSKNAIFRIDPQGRVLHANDYACQSLGYAIDELVGRPIWEFGPDCLPESWAPNWQLQRRHGVINFETQFKRKDGSAFPVEVSANHILHDGREYSVAFVRDVTERKLAEQQLKKLNQSLKEMVRQELAEIREKDHVLIAQSRLASMGEMIGNIAHQWRQPLSVLGLSFQNMELDFREGTLDERAMREYVRNAMSVVNGMSSTIDDFRNFFSSRRDKLDFDLHEAISQAVSMIELALVHHSIALRVTGDSAITVHGFPNEFSQVLLNLLSNAKDVLQERGRQGGAIEICSSRDEHRAKVTVRDNGGGIAEDILGKIFDPYFTTKQSGTGIGLYMSKTIMDNMGGTIAACNTEQGAEFILTLPLPEQQ